MTVCDVTRSILRDLSRILTLLNRKEEQIRTVPADWQRLLGWAERLLKRYKRQKISKVCGYVAKLFDYEVTDYTRSMIDG